jgi:AraC-like DNA-binding protein
LKLREQITVWCPAGVDSVELHRGLGVVHGVPRHWHEEYQLCMIQSGAGELFYRGVHHPISPWSLFIVHPGEVHSNRVTVGEACDYRTLNVASELMRQVAAGAAGREYGVLPFFPTAVLLETSLLCRFLRLHEIFEHAASPLERESVLLDTLGHFVERYAQTAPPPRPEGREPGAVARAREYLEAHYAADVRLADLSRLTGLTPYHLNRVFSRTLGLPPHAFQTQVRILHATRLLRLGRPPATVAAETGFADQSHFTRRFKTTVGVTPGAYRQRKNVQDGTRSAR